MPEISALLERAAAEPMGAPNIEGPLRKHRRRRLATGAAVLVAVVAVPAFFVSRPDEHESTVSTIVPKQGRSVVHHDVANRYSVIVPDGWHVADKPLAPWLGSPYDILNVATSELEPSRAPSNQAACPSEIPKVVVNGIGADGASLTIREWRPGVGLYAAEPRPLHAADLDWRPGCDLPSGMTNFGATFRDQGRDFSVLMVLGADAQAQRVVLEAILDDFRVDQPAGWTSARNDGGTVGVAVPPGWHRADRSLTPDLTDPVEVLALGTAALAPDPQQCGHVPAGAMHDLGDDDALVWVATRKQGFAGETNARPATIGPTDGTADSDLLGCLVPSDRERLFQRWIPFTDHGNEVYVAVAMGPNVTAERRAEVWAVVNSLQFAAR